MSSPFHRSLPPQGVPTLTEVVQLEPLPEASAAAPAPAAAARPVDAGEGADAFEADGAVSTEDMPEAPPVAVAVTAPVADGVARIVQPQPLRMAQSPLLPGLQLPPAQVAPPQHPPLTDAEAAEIHQRVLEDVQRQVDLVIEYRLRESLSPMLTRVADSLVREARHELASSLREIVAKAVAQEMSRHRSR